ncbi:hypothetical protein ACFL0C_01825 [Patescibacteria group bacterium]
MHKKTKKVKLLPILILTILAYFAGFYISPIFFAKQQKLNNDIAYEFNDLSDIDPKELDETSELVNALYGLEGYYDNWNWEENFVYAEIDEINLEPNELRLFMLRPTTESFSSDFNRVFEDCKSVEIVTLDEENNYELAKPKEDSTLENLYQDGDELFAYCLDEECLNIGKRCILKRRLQNN